MAERKYFGTDGVRGRANQHPITSEFAVVLGRAAGHLFSGRSRRGSIVIGKDTRLSGYMLETALASGIVSSGCDVVLVGPLPTPGIAFITKGLRCDAGIVISASHNPFTDNGIKFFDRYGYKLPDDVEAGIESALEANSNSSLVDATRIGYARRVDDAVGRYIVSLKETFPDELTLEGLKIVVDCAHGACYKVSPAVLGELGATVIALGVKPDGMNINEGVGALHPESIAQAVREQHADIGIALDGDGDRLVVVDASGQVVDGDALLAICALALLDAGNLAQNAMVATSMSNMGLELALRRRGATLLRSDVGDRYVMELMRERKLNFGGESSGHIIYRDHGTTGDGTLAALQVLAHMVRTGRSLAELAQVYEAVPQKQVGIRVHSKPRLESVQGYADALVAAESELNGTGRVLVRYSGTEPKVRVMVEGTDEVRVSRALTQLQDFLTRTLGA